MDFNRAITLLTWALEEKNPLQFSSSWIYRNEPRVYRFIWKNIRTELGTIDWDRVTVKLDRSYQARWHERRIRRLPPYSDPHELLLVMSKYLDKRYVFFSKNREDNEMRNLISVALVRLSQKGNIDAQKELLEYLRFMAEDWIDTYPTLWRWKWFSHELPQKLEGCIQRYRYTGTFVGYVYKTLEYSAMTLPRPPLLDDTKLYGAVRKVDSVIQDFDTGENRMADYNKYDSSPFTAMFSEHAVL